MTETEGVSRIVVAEDERPRRRDGTCYFCGNAIGTDHRSDCVVMKERLFDAVPSGVWLPIETLHFGEVVLLWFDKGEKGNGGMEVAQVFEHENDPTGMSFWTHGGPNAGYDWSPRDNEKPSRWMKIDRPKETQTIDHENMPPYETVTASCVSLRTQRTGLLKLMT